MDTLPKQGDLGDCILPTEQWIEIFPVFFLFDSQSANSQTLLFLQDIWRLFSEESVCVYVGKNFSSTL